MNDKKTPSNITIYTDGSCVGNGTDTATGGWSAVLDNSKIQMRISSGETSSLTIAVTSSRMEMQAVIEGLKAVKNKEATIRLYTDSTYVKDGATRWLQGWKRKGWKKSNGDPVMNIDLWLLLDEVMQELTVTVHKVKAHSGNVFNELADQLAKDATGNDLTKTRHRSGATQQTAPTLK